MKIVILGGTGLIGSSLKEDLLSDHEVECFGRDAFNSPNKLLSHLKGSDLVIQLSGSTIAKRWTKKLKGGLGKSGRCKQYACKSY